MSRKKVGATKRTAKNTRPDSPILRYLHSIDAKLDRISKQLAKSQSAPKRKRTARRPVLWARTPEEAEKLQKENPDATIIMTGVPRADRD
jgi:hypothetical protein